MSLLPQRKKSPEEIAKLRESLGIPGTEPVTSQALPEEAAPPHVTVETLTPTHHEAIVISESRTPPITGPMPTPVSHGPKPIHSLKRSERIAPLPTEEMPVSLPELPPEEAPIVLRNVRSLKKSEQGPIQVSPPKEPSPDSKIPVHRHSDQELIEIRRRETIAMLSSAKPDPRLAAAHPGILVPGYALAIAGALCFYDYQFPKEATAGCAATALLIAAFILIFRPISRHHAAFIAVIAMFVLVFGALHYFPQLLHAT